MIILFKNRSSEDTGILDVVAALEVFLGKPEIIHYLFPKYQDASLSVNISRDCQVHSNRVLNKLVCPSGKYWIVVLCIWRNLRSCVTHSALSALLVSNSWTANTPHRQRENERFRKWAQTWQHNLVLPSLIYSPSRKSFSVESTALWTFTCTTQADLDSAIVYSQAVK